MPIKRHRYPRYVVEAAGMFLLFALLRPLPLDAASFIGGKLAKTIGPRTRAHRTALKNLAMVFPELSIGDHVRIALAAWENVGRTAAEFSFLRTQTLASRVEIHGAEMLESVRAGGGRVAFIAAHFGNWELNARVACIQNFAFAAAYRPANNPWVEKFMAWMRAPLYAGLYPKGPKAALRLVRAAASKKPVGMLVDQKMNDGIAVPFFGRNAMTAPAIAEIALRYDLPVVPARVERLGGAHFKATIYPPLVFEKTGDTKTDVLKLMTEVNHVIESWVRECPEQWFWMHDRWGIAKQNQV